jgi:CubicO group peptidase (beta-lactamase class C family)
MVLVFSATKGMSGLAIALAHSRGLFDYDERVVAYWPEFGQRGKEAVTVRQLLAHQAGLFAMDRRPDAALVADLDRLAAELAAQEPTWAPGERQAYHGITIGFLEGELLRRVDPEHRSIGRWFQEEIADPLELDFYIRLPEEIPNHRLAVLSRPSLLSGMSTLVKMPVFGGAVLNRRSRINRALWGSELPEKAAEGRIYARNLEVPAGGGVGTARAMASAYGEFATGGGKLGLGHDTLSQLMAPPIPPLRGFRDACLKVEIPFSLGFAKPGPTDTSPGPSAFGAPGAGGSFAFADPDNGIGYAYVPNQMGAHAIDPRDEALRKSLYACISKMDDERSSGRSYVDFAVPAAPASKAPLDRG